MKRALGLMTVVVLGWSGVASAQSVAVDKTKDRAALVQALDSVIDKTPLKAARVTVQVRSLDDGTVVYAKDADELLNPASNVKLFTSATALAKLGPDYRFETEFLTDVELKEGKCKTLFVKGKGDPTITTERLYGIVSELVHTGLKEVQDIVIDESYFDGERQPPGFDQEYGDKSYLAPTGAVSLNWNSVGVYLRPGDSLGAAGTAEVEPMSDFFVVEGKVTTGAKNERRFTVTSGVDKDRVRQKFKVDGTVPLEKGSWSVWKKVDQPPLYFGFTLKSMLVARGLKVKGRIKTGEAPRNARMLYQAQSDSLDVVLKRLNKNSSNFIAEQLLKTLGAELKGVPGTSAHGAEAVEDFLTQDVGLPRGSFIMRNGSGLNDTNRFSAAQTTKLLVHMWQRFGVTAEFLSSLPIGGKDGTLKFRFDGTDAVGKLRAKTGTLENVSALSGYIQSAGGERFVFAIMVNDFAGRASNIVQHIDALGAAVAALGSTQGPNAAVVAMMQQPSVVGPLDEVKARLETYRGLAQKGDKRNAPFLRTAWRSEKDPAVRALIAEALFQSDPREPSTSRMLVDSALPSDEVWGRLRKIAVELKTDTPLIGALVEIGAAGSPDAIGRLFELVRASASDDEAQLILSEQLAVLAHDAPNDVITALRNAQQVDREAALDALAKGLVKVKESPLFNALKTAQANAEPTVGRFAKETESALSQRLEQARAPTDPKPTPQPGG